MGGDRAGYKNVIYAYDESLRINVESIYEWNRVKLKQVKRMILMVTDQRETTSTIALSMENGSRGRDGSCKAIRVSPGIRD